MWLALLPIALADSNHLLFVGNSYTMAGNLEAATMAWFLQGAPTGDDVSVRVATPGYTLPMHLADADGTNGDTPARAALVTGSDTWSWVMLQDQSQIPGFPEDQAEVLESLAALPALDAMIGAKGGQTVLLMTWGRRDGDEQNPDWYPDYPTMQGKLAAGYEGYAASITTGDRTAWVAPAGYGFRHVWNTALAAGEDPSSPDSLFYRLYQPDGSHPSALGTVIVSCVVYSTISGLPCTGLEGPPELDPADVALVQGAADAAVFEESPELVFPWTDAPIDEDTGDTAADTATRGDTGTVDDAPAVEADASEGCGCTSAGSPGAALALVGLLALRRSR